MWKLRTVSPLVNSNRLSFISSGNLFTPAHGRFFLLLFVTLPPPSLRKFAQYYTFFSTLLVTYCTLPTPFSWFRKISKAFELTSVLNCLFSFSVAVKLKSLFVLFAGYLVKNCASLLDATNISKTGKRLVYPTFLDFGPVGNRYDNNNVASYRRSVRAPPQKRRSAKIGETRFCPIFSFAISRAGPQLSTRLGKALFFRPADYGNWNYHFMKCWHLSFRWHGVHLYPYSGSNWSLIRDILYYQCFIIGWSIDYWLLFIFS